MIGAEYARTMAAYNKWRHDGLYGAADTLEDGGRRTDLRAFFGSIHGTLNHTLWGHRMWMSRFAGSAKPRQPNFAGSAEEGANWPYLKNARAKIDHSIIDWTESLDDALLARDLSWFSRALQVDVFKPMWMLVTHFFNNQIHYRGQVHAMLTSVGAKPDDTDLFIMPDSYLS